MTCVAELVWRLEFSRPLAAPMRPNLFQRMRRETLTVSRQRTSIHDACSSLSARRCGNDPSHEVLDRVQYDESVSSRTTQHCETAQRELLRFIDRCHCISLSVAYPSTRCRLPLQHDSLRTCGWLLLDLSTFGKTRDASFVPVPACRVFEEASFELHAKSDDCNFLR